MNHSHMTIGDDIREATVGPQQTIFKRLYSSTSLPTNRSTDAASVQVHR